VVSPDRISRLLALIDNSLDLEPLLGTDVNLSDLISNINNPTLKIHPLLQIAAQTFLSSNGQIQATVDLPTLGLTDATGQLIRHLVVQASTSKVDSVIETLTLADLQSQLPDSASTSTALDNLKSVAGGSLLASTRACQLPSLSVQLLYQCF
jgi:hypothetical protein